MSAKEPDAAASITILFIGDSYNYAGVVSERQGSKVFQRTVEKVTQRYRETRFVGFSVNEEFDKDYQWIFEAFGAKYFSGVFAYVEEQGDTNCRPRDGHWNHLGHEVAGHYLFEQFSVSFGDP